MFYYKSKDVIGSAREEDIATAMSWFSYLFIVREAVFLSRLYFGTVIQIVSVTIILITVGFHCLNLASSMGINRKNKLKAFLWEKQRKRLGFIWGVQGLGRGVERNWSADVFLMSTLRAFRFNYPLRSEWQTDKSRFSTKIKRNGKEKTKYCYTKCFT